MKRTMLFAVMTAITFTLCGCGNSIRNYEDSEDKVERTVIGTKYDVYFTPDPPVAAAFPVTALRVEKQQVKKYQVFIEGEVVTPYEGWRKAYEVPCGLLLVPASLCSHILSVFSFGLYPFSVSRAINDLAFSGLNPCINWESESRTERRPVSAKDKLVDEFQEDKGTPLPEARVLVESGELKRTYVTDKFGVFQLTLVGLSPTPAIFNADREFHFRVEDDARTTRTLTITRDFAGKLLRARAIIIEYEMSPSGKKLVDAVKKIENLKFNQLASDLEKRELGKHKNDSAFMTDFNNASME